MFDWLRDLGKSQEEKRQERLNAYLDNALTAQERQVLEQELTRNEPLRSELEQLRLFKAAVHDLPRVAVPRNFTLTPEMAGLTRRQPSRPYYPALRLATTLTAFLLVAMLALELVTMGAGGVAFDETSSANIAMEEDANDAAAYDAGDGTVENDADGTDRATTNEAPQVMAETAADEAMEEIAAAGEVAEEPAAEEESDAAAPTDDESDTGASPQTTITVSLTPTFTPTATPTATVTPTPTQTPVPPPPQVPDRPVARLSPLRWAQIGLGAIFLALLSATLISRRRVDREQ